MSQIPGAKQSNPEVPKDWRLEAGPLRRFFNDPTVSEIMVNRWDRIFVERKGVIEETDIKFDSADALMRFISAVAVSVGKEINRRTPIIDARMGDGSRLNIVVPPVALDGPILTIRKFSQATLSYKTLLESLAFDEKILYFLSQAVVAKQNIIVSGGTGTGKTTLLNVLSQFIPQRERVVTIEDTSELQLNIRNLVRMESRSSMTGEVGLTIPDLIRNSLRMRPDRIVVGETRGAEAFDMLQAMNTGHEGSMSTVHANSAYDALRRIESMVMLAVHDVPIIIVKEDISRTIDLVIQVERDPTGPRRVVEISEVTGMSETNYNVHRIFQWTPAGGFASTGYVPEFVEKNTNAAISLPGLFFDPDHKIQIAS